MERMEVAEQVLDSFVPVEPIVVLVELAFVQMLGPGWKELIQVQS